MNPSHLAPDDTPVDETPLPAETAHHVWSSLVVGGNPPEAQWDHDRDMKLVIDNDTGGEKNYKIETTTEIVNRDEFGDLDDGIIQVECPISPCVCSSHTCDLAGINKGPSFVLQ